MMRAYSGQSRVQYGQCDIDICIAKAIQQIFEVGPHANLPLFCLPNLLFTHACDLSGCHQTNRCKQEWEQTYSDICLHLCQQLTLHPAADQYVLNRVLKYKN